MRYLARIVATVWAGWWTFFGLASGLGEELSLTGVVIHTTIPGLIFVLTVVLAWRWEIAGGLVMMAVGLLTLVYYPIATTWPGALTLAIPPILAGALFLWNGWRLGQGGSHIRHFHP